MTRNISFGVLLGILSLVAEGLSQLLITSKLLRTFTPAEVGFWFLVTNFIVLIQIGQGGLSPVGVRRLSQALPKGFAAWRTETYTLGKAYLWACSMLTILVVAIGSYISSVAARSGIVEWKTLWFFFSFGLLCRTYALRWVNAINSTGMVGIDKIVLIAGIFLNICGYWTVSSLNLSITYLGVVYGIVGALYMLSIYAVYRRYGLARANLPTPPPKGAGHEQAGFEAFTIRQYAKQSSYFLILNVAGFFVLNLDVLMVGTLFGTSKVPYFSILAKLGFLVLAVSTLFQQMAFPFVSRAWGNKDFATVRSLYFSGLALSMSVAVIGSLILLIAAPTLIPLWLGPNSYLGAAVLGSQLLFVIISVHTISQATPVLATGTHQFVDLAIVSSILAVACSWMFAKIFGLVGVPLGNAVGTFIPSVIYGLRSYRALVPTRG
jgi:O-antigen/teichoic acid export membrane protein